MHVNAYRKRKSRKGSIPAMQCNAHPIVFIWTSGRIVSQAKCCEPGLIMNTAMMDRQTQTDTDRQTEEHRQTNRQTNRMTQTDRQTEQQTDRQTEQQTDRQTEQQTDRQTEQQTNQHTVPATVFFLSYLQLTIKMVATTTLARARPCICAFDYYESLIIRKQKIWN